MANEKEVRTGERRATCSVTGRSCGCGDSGRCESRLGRGNVDPIAGENVRTLKTVRVYLEACKDNLDAIQQDALLHRKYPGPEVREIRRKCETAQAMIDELVGDL